MRELCRETIGRVLLNAAVPAEEGAASAPTVFPELNELLAELVARVEAILGDNFVGAYLIGVRSRSEAPIFTATATSSSSPRQRVTAEQEQAASRRFTTRSRRAPGTGRTIWRARTRRGRSWRRSRLSIRQWLYVDRGRREMQWSTHCNTEDVRWTLRERGITLSGPDPRRLVARGAG